MFLSLFILKSVGGLEMGRKVQQGQFGQQTSEMLYPGRIISLNKNNGILKNNNNNWKVPASTHVMKPQRVGIVAKLVGSTLREFVTSLALMTLNSSQLCSRCANGVVTAISAS